MSELTPFHQEQLVHYLDFARHKRLEHLHEVDAAFLEAKESRLLEDTYTQKEVQNILEGLRDVVKSDVQKELLHTSHCNVLLLRQLFTQAEKIYLDLKIDTDELENINLLKEIANFEESSQTHKGKDGKLAPLPAYSDKALQHAVGAIKDEKEKAQERFVKLQQQLTTILKEKTAMGIELEKLRAEVKELGSSKASSPSSSAQKVVDTAEIDKLKKKIDEINLQLTEKSSEARNAEKELMKKVNETTPFTNMKKMVKKKNDQIKTLRERLSKYESPDLGNEELDEGDDA